MKKCKKITVKGIVQGVYFRDSTKQKAVELDITGHVKNNFDGSVEIIACGNKDRLDAFIEWCHIGPKAAKVESVNIEDIDYCEKIKDFKIVFDRF